MKKLFGEFLVEKNLIDEQSLVEILIEQHSSSKSIPRILFESELIGASDLLKIFRAQTEYKIEFVEACKRLNLWSSEIEDQVHSRLAENTKLLGLLLIENGLISTTDLMQALEDYNQQNGSGDQPKAAPRVSKSKKPASSRR